MAEIEPLSKEELQAILDEAEKTNEFDFMLFTVLKTTGRRIGELYGIEESKEIDRKVVGKRTIYIKGKPVEIDRTIPLYKKTGKLVYGVKVKDLDFSKGVMKVWVLKRKRHVQDETVLLPGTMRLLSRHINKNKLKLDDYVFRIKGRGLRQIHNKMRFYAKRAGINKRVTIHNLRHYFITELKRKGWPDDKIIKLTGHRSPQVLRIYDHIVATDLKEEAKEAIKDI